MLWLSVTPQPADEIRAPSPSQPFVRRLFAPTRDCGSASLYLICRLTGRPQPLPSLRELTRTSSSGTNMFHLKEAADTLGFEVTAIEGSFNDLYDHLSGRSAFAVLHLDRGHFVAAVTTSPHSERGVILLDPSKGILDASESVLREDFQWSGAMLLLTDHVETASRG